MFVQKESECLECGKKFTDGKHLSRHLTSCHGMTFREHIVKHSYGGIQPLCVVPGCDNVPRLKGREFVKYCKEHRHEACVDGGKVGGVIKETWNKGETRETDLRIDNQARKMTGSGNPFWGREHTEDSKKQMSETKRLKGETLEERLRLRCRLPGDPGYGTLITDEEVDNE